jgi:transcriptional regulator with XRE-family HTH domain
MAMGLGNKLEKLRNRLDLNQATFGEIFGTTAMAVSRWEREQNPIPSRVLLGLGLLARNAGLDGWLFWEAAGVTRADAHAMLRPEKSKSLVRRKSLL